MKEKLNKKIKAEKTKSYIILTRGKTMESLCFILSLCYIIFIKKGILMGRNVIIFSSIISIGYISVFILNRIGKKEYSKEFEKYKERVGMYEICFYPRYKKTSIYGQEKNVIEKYGENIDYKALNLSDVLIKK